MILIGRIVLVGVDGVEYRGFVASGILCLIALLGSVLVRTFPVVAGLQLEVVGYLILIIESGFIGVIVDILRTILP